MSLFGCSRQTFNFLPMVLLHIGILKKHYTLLLNNSNTYIRFVCLLLFLKISDVNSTCHRLAWRLVKTLFKFIRTDWFIILLRVVVYLWNRNVTSRCVNDAFLPKLIYNCVIGMRYSGYGDESKIWNERTTRAQV